MGVFFVQFLGEFEDTINCFQDFLNFNTGYIKIPTDDQMNMMDRTALKQIIVDLSNESKNELEGKSENPSLPNENQELPDENDFGLVFVKENNTSTTLRENSVHEGKKPFKCDNCVSVNNSEHLSETVIELQDKLEKERNECKERAKECLSWKAKFEESEKQNKKLAKEVEKEKEMARENLLVKVA